MRDIDRPRVMSMSKPHRFSANPTLLPTGLSSPLCRLPTSAIAETGIIWDEPPFCDRPITRDAPCGKFLSESAHRLEILLHINQNEPGIGEGLDRAAREGDLELAAIEAGGGRVGGAPGVVNLALGAVRAVTDLVDRGRRGDDRGAAGDGGELEDDRGALDVDRGASAVPKGRVQAARRVARFDLESRRGNCCSFTGPLPWFFPL